MKKWDILLFISIIVIAAVWFIMIHVEPKKGDFVTISVDGIETARYDLYKDFSVDIAGYQGGSNHLEIRDGIVDVTDASCPDGLCVHQMQIRRTGEKIVCLPNRVVIQITGNDISEFDAITQ